MTAPVLPTAKEIVDAFARVQETVLDPINQMMSDVRAMALKAGVPEERIPAAMKAFAKELVPHAGREASVKPLKHYRRWWRGYAAALVGPKPKLSGAKPGFKLDFDATHQLEAGPAFTMQGAVRMLLGDIYAEHGDDFRPSDFVMRPRQVAGNRWFACAWWTMPETEQQVTRLATGMLRIRRVSIDARGWLLRDHGDGVRNDAGFVRAESDAEFSAFQRAPDGARQASLSAQQRAPSEIADDDQVERASGEGLDVVLRQRGFFRLAGRLDSHTWLEPDAEFRDRAMGRDSRESPRRHAATWLPKAGERVRIRSGVKRGSTGVTTTAPFDFGGTLSVRVNLTGTAPESFSTFALSNLEPAP